MKKTNYFLLTVMAVIFISSIYVTNILADDDDDDDHSKYKKNMLSKLFYDDDHKNKKGFLLKSIAPVNNELYRKECGSCHFAFQPGLLPSSSWKLIMDDLGNHFEEDATLNKDIKNELAKYLEKNAAEFSGSKRSIKILRSMGTKTSTRISKTPYFVHEHNDIPPRILNRKSIKTISNCSACHKTAEQGIYSERNIQVPK